MYLNLKLDCSAIHIRQLLAYFFEGYFFVNVFLVNIFQLFMIQHCTLVDSQCVYYLCFSVFWGCSSFAFVQLFLEVIDCSIDRA